jgi:hypothetical protein
MFFRFGLAGVALSVCAIHCPREGVLAIPASVSERRPVVTLVPEEVDSLLRQRDLICRKALEVLTDACEPVQSRVNAARILGRLKYEPAIAKLAQNVHVIQGQAHPTPGPVPGIGSATVEWEQLYPCMQPLADFGLLALPEILRVCLDKSTSDKTEFLLCYCLKLAGIQKEARRYVLGIHGEYQEPYARRRLARLLQFLAETE